MARNELEDLGATLPLVAAPMAGGPSGPALVTAAARAGATGFLAGGYKSRAALADEIAAVRAATSRFGVNLFAPTPVPVAAGDFDAYAAALADLARTLGVDLASQPREDDDGWEDKIDLLLEKPVPLVSLTFGFPSASQVEALHRAGTRVVQTVTHPDEAIAAREVGADILVVQSAEAGGHSGTIDPERAPLDMSLPTLLGAVRGVSDLPLWGAGGIGTARAVQETLSAGAQAAVVGTVLLRSPESGANPTYKGALADAGRASRTVVTRAFSGRPARALVNDFVEQFDARAPSGYPALHHLTSPLRKAAAAAGDPEAINIWAGTAHRHATDEPVEVILRRLAGR